MLDLDQQVPTEIIGAPVKPLPVCYREAVSELNGAINNLMRRYDLPFCLMAGMVKDVLNQLQSEADIEYAEYANIYYKAKAEFEMTTQQPKCED